MAEQSLREKIRHIFIDTQEGGAIHLRDEEIDQILSTVYADLAKKVEGMKQYDKWSDYDSALSNVLKLLSEEGKK